MGYLSNIKKQYLISLFQSLIPAYVIERLFWQQRGMNVQMVVYCEIIYAVTIVLFEIPSGILADKFGRKRLLVINSALAAVEFIILLFANSFWIFGIAVSLSGIGKAFSSGSQNALLYDSLLVEKKENSFEKFLGRLYAVDFTGSMIAALSGSILANMFGFEFNYIVSFFSMFFAFIITLSLREPPIITKQERELTEIKQYAKQALLIFKKKPLVFIYGLTGAVLGACLIYLDEFWQLILDNVGISVAFFGIIGAVEMSFKISGNLLAYRLKEKLSYKIILIGILIFNVTGYIAIYYTRNVFCLIPMIAISLVAGIVEPLITGYLHHNTESYIRATVESFSSLGLRLISILIGLIFGYISTSFSLFAAFAYLGVICLLYLLFFLLAEKRQEA